MITKEQVDFKHKLYKVYVAFLKKACLNKTFLNLIFNNLIILHKLESEISKLKLQQLLK